MARRSKFMTFKQFLQAYGEALTQRAVAEVEAVSAEAVKECKASPAFKDRTGKLRESIHAEKRNKGLRQSILVNAANDKGVQYGWFVEASHPFLFPVVRMHRAELRDRAINVIKGATADVQR